MLLVLDPTIWRHAPIFGGVGCHVVHPSDTAPALVALGATARVVGPDGARNIALEDFFVLPTQDPTRENVLDTGEMVTEVVVPAQGSRQRGSYTKVRGRRSWDFALVGVALALGMASDGTVESARVVFSGVAPTPWRSDAAEQVLTGERLSPELIRQAAEAAVEGAQPSDRAI